jgi:hypothetical protein
MPDSDSYPQWFVLLGYVAQSVMWVSYKYISECGPLVAVDPHNCCLVLHLYDELVTVFSIQAASPAILGPVFHPDWKNGCCSV